MNLYYKLILIFTISFFSLSEVNSQINPIFEKIDNSEGLLNGRVTSIVSDPHGFVWIGTQNGLNRYDGFSSKVYNRRNSNISSNDISDIIFDSKNRLWVATLGGGLNLYNQDLDDFESFKSSDSANSIISNQINVIFEDNEDQIWLGTENGLSLYDEQADNFINFQDIDTINGLNLNGVTSIAQLNKKYLYIGTFGGGLMKFNLETQKFDKIKSETSSFIYTIYPDHNNHLLLGTSEGLSYYDVDKNKISNYFEDIRLNEEISIVRAIKRDTKGTLWLGTDGNGLYKVNESNKSSNKIQNYLSNSQLRSSLSGNAIYDIMEDKNSNLWIGTAWNGINILENDKNYELLYSDIKGSNPLPVLAIYATNNRIFMGLDGNGLTSYSTPNNKIQYYNKEENYIGANYIQYMTRGIDSSKLWIGTFSNGLIEFDIKDEDFKKYTYDPKIKTSLSYNDVRYIIPELNGDLWIATWGGGLNYFDSKNNLFQKVTAGKSLLSNNLVALQKDDQKLWIATFGGGLGLYNIEKETFKNFKFEENNSNTPSSNKLFSILLDSSGRLWIGTSGAGINSYSPNDGIFERFSNEERLKYATITAILEDNKGDIWFSTKQGIWQYRKKEKKFRRFPDLENEFHINSAFKDENGLLYFGGIKGVARFDPSTISYNSETPKVILTSFKLFNEEVSIKENKNLSKAISRTEKLVLEHDADVITFEFAALKFPFSENCEYAIKLENFDENWRNIGKDRTATFTNLAPGEYTLKIKSKEVWGNWGNDYTSIELEILKPFWMQWWALCIYTILILILFYLFRKYIIAWEQMKANLRLEKFSHEKDKEIYTLKQQFFTNISHEIRTPVTLILGGITSLIEKGQFIDKKPYNAIKIIQKHSNHLLRLVDELLDSRNLELNSVKLKVTKEDWIDFCEEIFISFTENATQKKINFQWYTDQKNALIWFDLNQMEKVLYNLFSNALKFTPLGGNINISNKICENFVQLKITDSGIGISKKQQSKIFNRFYQTNSSKQLQDSGFGLGLSISKEIVELHGGKLWVESEKGKGSTFILELKKGKEHFSEDLILINGINKKEYSLSSKKIETFTNSHHLDLEILKNESILIVEDNPEVSEYIKSILENYCTIILASHGQEAIEKTEAHQIDLIISDIMMPIMDGVQLTKLLKSSSQTSHIPIILLTARATVVQQMEGYETGADIYITKPFTEKILKLRIINLMKRRNLLREKFRSEIPIHLPDLAINSLDEEFLTKLHSILNKNIGKGNLHAEIISKEIGMSHSVMYKKIKSITGMTFIEFIQDFKLKTAKDLISKKGFSVSEACYHVGYSDRKYFSKLFKKKFGSTPSSYSN